VPARHYTAQARLGTTRLGTVQQAQYKKRDVPCCASVPQCWPRHGPKECKPCLTCRAGTLAKRARAGPDTDFTKNTEFKENQGKISKQRIKQVVKLKVIEKGVVQWLPH